MTVSGGQGRWRPRPLVPEISTTLAATAVEQHRAAQVVADHATDLDDARELLDMLGLLGEVSTHPGDPPHRP